MTRSEHQSDSGKFITLIYLRCFNFHLQLYFNKNEKNNKKSESSKQPPPHVLKIPEIMKATKDLDESLLMRRGWFGDVYYGELLHGSILVPTAIKRYTRRGPTDSWPDVGKQELYALRHPNLVSMIGYCDDDRYEKEIILLYEYISSRKSLNDHLHVLGTPLPWIRRLEICIGVAHGLEYLHSAGVTHGDIRSHNIMMTGSLVPKITDYGLSELSLAYRPTAVSIPLRACGYVDAATIDRHGGLTMKSDVYSLGVLFLELLCGRPVLDYNRPREDPQRYLANCVRSSSLTLLEEVIDSNVKDEISKDCLDIFVEIAKRCVNEYQQERPDMAEVVTSLESILALQKSHTRQGALSVKMLTYDVLKIATSDFSQNLAFGETEEVYLGWLELELEQEKLAPPSKEGVGIAVAVASKSMAHDDWMEEVNFMGQLDHPNIIKLLGCCKSDGDGNFLVYEHMQRSLRHFIHGDDGLEPLSWGARINILIGVARGMAYLYTDKALLCNFRFDDILLDEALNAKLGGFGWVHVVKKSKGVFGYLKAVYDPKTGFLPMKDVVSFGFVVLETIAAKPPEDVLMDLRSMGLGAPNKIKTNKRELKKKLDPRLQGNYTSKAAFDCIALALKCIRPTCKPSWEEILWSLERINALN
ncbi:putative protein kinase RLK-Pelle-CrRLK1L-1 family [Helianthus annuus]|uniref:Putative mitogen-activated protein (MAP) kinase kinase kinase, MLK1/MLK2/MLK4 n=1 Tax=Helianthus annuus TaxID=4232 RepID=A0A251UV70_HELAN|nr:probable serine/threonine-protein kinase PBL6 [Helianthus annuus]KAF5808258.1 putative protein kinase RLK-Pelle-CrRLK1L-1 family [Helianthus annuus]KAJ0595427.1 putative protein kinase RLK-Pelle-CrRLK1L-1 family [Helianthus annuus]KAJ0925028.1 putative protein kinase RLK-Pelle-CrRLK1L-1 family [Helianthus annuus]